MTFSMHYELCLGFCLFAFGLFFVEDCFKVLHGHIKPPKWHLKEPLIPVRWIVMRLSVSMCVIGSLICNQNDELHVILTILILQCSHIKNDTPSLCIPVATMGNVSHHQKSCNFADLKHSTTITVLYWIWQPRILTLTCSSSYSVYKPSTWWSHSDLHLYSICCLCSVKVG